MTDQAQRLEIATVRAEIGSNITYRFNNDAIDAAGIPTESGDIKNLKQIIKTIEDKASVPTSIYPNVSTGLAATPEGGMFLVVSSDADEIYEVWRKVSGAAVDTGKRALTAQSIDDALASADASADQAAASAASAASESARFLLPSATAPLVRDNGEPLQDGDLYPNTTDSLSYSRVSGAWLAVDSNQRASEALVGISRFATLAEVVSGASGAIGVSPSYLKNGFASSFGANGYIVFPTWMGSFMVQWGRYSLAAPVASTVVVKFPIPFGTVLHAWVGVDVAASEQVGTQVITATGMTVSKGSADVAPRTGSWFALGGAF